MQTRLKMLHDWNHQLRLLLPGVRSTRVDALALFTLGVLWSGSATLLKVASRLPLGAADMSTERRLRRWLANRAVPVTAAWRPLVKAMLASRAGTELTLALDPTPHGPRRTDPAGRTPQGGDCARARRSQAGAAATVAHRADPGRMGASADGVPRAHVPGGGGLAPGGLRSHAGGG
jgi:hypothetical protein